MFTGVIAAPRSESSEGSVAFDASGRKHRIPNDAVRTGRNRRRNPTAELPRCVQVDRVAERGRFHVIVVGASVGIAAVTAIGGKKSSAPSAMVAGAPSCSRVVTRAAFTPASDAVMRSRVRLPARSTACRDRSLAAHRTTGHR